MVVDVACDGECYWEKNKKRVVDDGGGRIVVFGNQVVGIPCSPQIASAPLNRNCFLPVRSPPYDSDLGTLHLYEDEGGM